MESVGPGLDQRVDQRRSMVRAAALLMGASFFAYLFAVAVHEVGHYLASVVLGVPEPGIVLHPFDLSHNIYGGDLSEALGTPMRRAFSGAAGPMFNLLLGVGVGLLLWRRRSPVLLPVLMLGPVALVQEGVGMIIGLVDYPELRSDWVEVMLAGVPPVVVGLSAVTLLGFGFLWLQLLLPLAGVSPEDGSWRILPVLLTGIPALMLAAVVYLNVAGASADGPPGMAIQNRSIALGASFTFVTIIAASYRRLFPRLDRISHTPPFLVSWAEVGSAMCLGAAVFAFQLVLFN